MEELFEAEQIINDMLVEEPDGMIIRKWQVKWKGYEGEDDNTFEPKSHLQHLGLWQEYEKLKHTNNTNNTNSNDTMENNTDISMIQQLKYLKDLKKTISILCSNTSNNLLISQQTFSNVVNIKKIEKLVTLSEKKIISKLPKSTPDEILQGIKINHNCTELYKECIKIFIKYIEKSKISIETLTDLNINGKLVELIKTNENEPELQYLSIYILNLISTKYNLHCDDIIQVLIGVIVKSKDKNIINNVISILGNISSKNGKILIEQKENIFKYLLLLCVPNNPNTSIDTLIIIAQIISNICKYKLLRTEHINEIIKCLSVLIMYDISDILSSTIYAYNQIFTYLILPSDKEDNIDIFGGVNHKILKQQIEDKSNKDELLTVGCIKNKWKILNIPIVINTLIKGYFTPFGMMKINCMKFNKIQRFVSLIGHQCDKIKSFDLILLCCIIASASKSKYIKQTVTDIMNFGVIGYLKIIYSGNNIENDQRCLMLICAIIEYGNNEQVKVFMEKQILFPFILKVAIKQNIDDYTQNCICRALKQVLNVYKHWNVDVLHLIKNEIDKLKKNKHVIQSNKKYLKTLIHKIESQ